MVKEIKLDVSFYFATLLYVINFVLKHKLLYYKFQELEFILTRKTKQALIKSYIYDRFN